MPAYYPVSLPLISLSSTGKETVIVFDSVNTIHIGGGDLTAYLERNLSEYHDGYGFTTRRDMKEKNVFWSNGFRWRN